MNEREYFESLITENQKLKSELQKKSTEIIEMRKALFYCYNSTREFQSQIQAHSFGPTLALIGEALGIEE